MNVVLTKAPVPKISKTPDRKEKKKAAYNVSLAMRLEHLSCDC